MAFQLDAKFFRRAKKVNRAVEITDSHAIIPALKDSPEIRVDLPNRRPKTHEERQATLEARYQDIAALEDEIEVERKQLIDLTMNFNTLKSGAADVVVQNLKVQSLMEKRKALQYPEIWIEEISGVTRKDIFESKRDIRKIDGKILHQIKHRIEPISSLYVDLSGKGYEGEVVEDVVFAPVVSNPVSKPIAKTTEQMKQQAKVGAIVQAQTKKAITLKKPTAAGIL